jgi:hypothetical protein
MHSTAPDGQSIFTWQGRDPVTDKKRLADLIAEAAAAELFAVNSQLVLLHAGQLTPVGKDLLRETIARHVVTPQLVDRGTLGWVVERHPFEFPIGADVSKQPDQKILLELIEMLIERVAKGPSAAVNLSVQQQREVRERAKMGEPLARVADAYGVDVAVVRQLAS